MDEQAEAGLSKIKLSLLVINSIFLKIIIVIYEMWAIKKIFTLLETLNTHLSISWPACLTHDFHAIRPTAPRHPRDSEGYASLQC
jgi:hypothetical protein